MTTQRFLTTHAGSLPRPADVAQRVFAATDSGAWQPDDAEFLAGAVADIVARQCDMGLDLVNDGEITRLRYWDVITKRFTGVDPFVEEHERGKTGRFEGYAQLQMRPLDYPTPPERIALMPVISGPVSYTEPGDLAAEIERLQAALPAGRRGFMTAPSPALVALLCRNDHYDDHESLVVAVAEALAHEYRFILDSGLDLQIDSPDLPSCWRGRTVEEGRVDAQRHLDILRGALAGLPAERIRLHVCWGNDEAPHDDDVEVRHFTDLLVAMPVGALVLEAANPRHAHEWRVWDGIDLDGKKLIVGALDSTTNFVEHPELVADRLCQYASVAGAENVIAGTDCGFGTWAHFFRVDPRIAWAKLESLVEGARRATARIADAEPAAAR